jgi:hypothetical protein
MCPVVAVGDLPKSEKKGSTVYHGHGRAYRAKIHSEQSHIRGLIAASRHWPSAPRATTSTFPIKALTQRAPWASAFIPLYYSL